MQAVRWPWRGLSPCGCRAHVGARAQEVSLAEVFATVEAERERLEILDYAVSQTSLEQVFLGFAKRQDEHTA